MGPAAGREWAFVGVAAGGRVPQRAAACPSGQQRAPSRPSVPQRAPACLLRTAVTAMDPVTKGTCRAGAATHNPPLNRNQIQGVVFSDGTPNTPTTATVGSTFYLCSNLKTSLTANNSLVAQPVQLNCSGSRHAPGRFRWWCSLGGGSGGGGGGAGVLVLARLARLAACRPAPPAWPAAAAPCDDALPACSAPCPAPPAVAQLRHPVAGQPLHF